MMSEDLQKTMMAHIKDKGVHCPFCGFTGMGRRPVDGTHAQQGELRQERVCWRCNRVWVIEYDMARIRFGPGLFDRLGEIKEGLTGRKAALNRLLRHARNLKW